MGEINNYSTLQAKQQYAASQPDPHNPFTKAGLPTPDQRWDSNSAPYSETQFIANARKQEQMKLDDLAQMYEIQKDANGNYDTSSKYSTRHYAPNAGKHGIAIDPAKIKAAKSGNDAVGVDDSTLRKAFDAVKHSFGWPANGQPLTLDDSQLADFKGKMLQFLQQSDAKRIPEMKARGLEQKYIDKLTWTPDRLDQFLNISDASNIGAYDKVDQRKVHNAELFAGAQKKMHDMSIEDLGRRAAYAAFLNQTGQTPLAMGLQQRLAGVRQIAGWTRGSLDNGYLR